MLPKISVEYYNAEQLVVLNGRVAVITKGKVRVNTHNQGIIYAVLGGMYGQGRILGYDQADNGFINDPQTWMQVAINNTEIIFFSKYDFADLWLKSRVLNSDLNTVNYMLSKNAIWNKLSESTQSHLFFDGLECKKFKNDQFICKMNRR